MRIFAMIAVAGIALGGVAAAAVSQDPVARARARAAHILEGRTAEPVVHRVNQRLVRGNRSHDDGGILFGEDIDSRVYVNRPTGGCPSLDGGRFLITRSPTGNLCAGDIVSVREPGPGPDVGSCALGDFTPYRRARR